MSAKVYYKLIDLMDNEGNSLDEAMEILVQEGYNDHEIESAAHKIRLRLTKEE